MGSHGHTYQAADDMPATSTGARRCLLWWLPLTDMISLSCFLRIFLKPVLLACITAGGHEKQYHCSCHKTTIQNRASNTALLFTKLSREPPATGRQSRMCYYNRYAHHLSIPSMTHTTHDQDWPKGSLHPLLLGADSISTAAEQMLCTLTIVQLDPLHGINSCIICV